MTYFSQNFFYFTFCIYLGSFTHGIFFDMGGGGFISVIFFFFWSHSMQRSISKLELFISFLEKHVWTKFRGKCLYGGRRRKKHVRKGLTPFLPVQRKAAFWRTHIFVFSMHINRFSMVSNVRFWEEKYIFIIFPTKYIF